MIYPVKILDKNNKVKKIISASKLTDEYWKRFYEEEDQIGLMHGPKSANVPPAVRKRIESRHAGLYDFSFSFIN